MTADVADPAPPQGAQELSGCDAHRSKAALIFVLTMVSDRTSGYDPKRTSFENWRAAGLWDGKIGSDGGC